VANGLTWRRGQQIDTFDGAHLERAFACQKAAHALGDGIGSITRKFA
jgi:hypothetical protein